MSEGEDMNERLPRSLQGLLRMTAQQAREQGTPSQFEEMSEERRKFLEEAISSFSEDTYVKRMLKCLEVLSKEDVEDDDDDSKEMAFEDLDSMVDLIDNANDLHKIGGFPIVVRYLHHNQSELRWRSADLIAVLSQNNPYCQTHLNSLGVIPVLLQLLDNDTVDQVRIKALYALSSMTSNFPEGKTVFLDNDGLSSLVRALQAKISKVRIKSSSMLRSMISESLLSEDSTIKEALVNMGIVEQLVSLLHEQHELFHEFIADSLAILSENLPKVVQECQRPQLQLEKILHERIHELEKEDKEAFETEIECYKRLLAQCFGNTAYEMDSSLR
ncbi:hsp70-binding protein 1 isoform X1 [Exaiptasia diaphana]|uniref:Nucleotide exchange factor Fes1 domain-containing protein n=1 Tax=Exaiptasia diaphana TaxID=2652724 RepID=A0A913X703_EXADI|nr:hsp70-binding protein 1 isoform X1 [Exaiptasia diaphana]KXJ14596.1 Hsp70-binding protein 1 [Exaiptasia diaphana]